MFYEGTESNLGFFWDSKMIIHVVVAFLILLLSSLSKLPYRALISNMRHLCTNDVFIASAFTSFILMPMVVIRQSRQRFLWNFLKAQ
jgi:hypothetical protein